MQEIKCPMCSMLTSADERFCSFCGAALHPEKLDAQSDVAKADLRDWLQSLRSADYSDTQDRPQEESSPIWLDEQPGQSDQVSIDPGLGPDFTTGFSGEVESKVEELPIWLSDQTSEEEIPDSLSSEPPIKKEFQTEANQWLSRIEGMEDEEQDHSFINLDRSSEIEESLPPAQSPQEQPFIQDELEPSPWSSSESVDSLKEADLDHGPDFLAVEPTIEKFELKLQTESTKIDQEYDVKSPMDEFDIDTLDFDSIPGIAKDEEIGAPNSLEELDFENLETLPKESSSLWLSEAGYKEEIPEVVSGEEELDIDIEPAELPSWMHALRPIEATNIPPEIPVKVETEKPEVAGPLVGLKGALPAEPDISRSQKPSSYSVKLQVTEVQQSQAALLKSMIQVEGEAQPLPVHPEITSQHVLRVVFAIILILAALFPIAAGLPQVGLPAEVPGIANTIQLIDGIAAGMPVLLAIDYTPGFSGEMDATTSPVVDHLMRRGVFITLVSTNPTGPVQAERLIASVNREGNYGYRFPDQYINLGFIPGASASLLRFREAPSLVLPREIQGDPAWNKQPLNLVKDISGFSMVIVATENPDNARAWIEQVQPGLKGIPLILIVSSQAEPILRPYFDAVPQKVQGLIGGLAGSASYLSQIKADGQASFYWSSFSISMMLAGLLIVIGGLINLAFAYAEHRKEHK